MCVFWEAFRFPLKTENMLLGLIGDYKLSFRCEFQCVHHLSLSVPAVSTVQGCNPSLPNNSLVSSSIHVPLSRTKQVRMMSD